MKLGNVWKNWIMYLEFLLVLVKPGDAWKNRTMFFTMLSLYDCETWQCMERLDVFEHSVCFYCNTGQWLENGTLFFSVLSVCSLDWEQWLEDQVHVFQQPA